MSRARAERQIFGSDEKVKSKKNPKTGRTETVQKQAQVGRKLQAALKEDLAKTAGFDTEDVLMGNRAEYIINEDTAQDYSDAQTTGKPMRTATSFSEERTKDSAPLKRDDTRLKAIENIDPETRKEL